MRRHRFDDGPFIVNVHVGSTTVAMAGASPSVPTLRRYVFVVHVFTYQQNPLAARQYHF